MGNCIITSHASKVQIIAPTLQGLQWHSFGDKTLRAPTIFGNSATQPTSTRGSAACTLDPSKVYLAFFTWQYEDDGQIKIDLGTVSGGTSVVNTRTLVGQGSNGILYPLGLIDFTEPNLIVELYMNVTVSFGLVQLT